MRAVNHKITKPYERVQRALLNNEPLTFKALLSKNNHTTIHVENIQNLVIEFYKCLHSPLAHIQRIIYKRVLNYNLRSCGMTLVKNLVRNKKLAL